MARRNETKPGQRCSWVNLDDTLLVEYHDREWGVPAHSDRKHFEGLVLSGAQAGLNWSLVLKKREGYRRAFEKFDLEKVARYSGRQIQTLLADADIIRNRMKIEGAVRNARALLKVQEEFGEARVAAATIQIGRTEPQESSGVMATTKESAMNVNILRTKKTI